MREPGRPPIGARPPARAAAEGGDLGGGRPRGRGALVFGLVVLAVLPGGRAKAGPLNPLAFASQGDFAKGGATTYFVRTVVENRNDIPVLQDSTGKTIFTGEYTGKGQIGVLESKIAVFDFDSFVVNKGVSIIDETNPSKGFNVSHPVAFLSRGAVDVSGKIVGDGGDGMPGGTVKSGNTAPGISLGGNGTAGGYDGGRGGSTNENGNGGGGTGGGKGGEFGEGAGGGGGGGFGGKGGMGGGTSPNGGEGGGTYGDLAKMLQGGSGGGGGGGGASPMINTGYGAGGGAGGGAIEIGAIGAIQISGLISVNGGKGGPGNGLGDFDGFAGGGGGSGGGILIHGMSVDLTGMLLANGGMGGAPGSHGKGGAGGGAGEVTILSTKDFTGNKANIQLTGGKGGDGGGMGENADPVFGPLSVPEPPSLVLVASGAAALALAFARRRRNLRRSSPRSRPGLQVAG